MPTQSPTRARRSTAAMPSPWSASRPERSATCSRARPSTSRSMLTPPICSYSDRWRAASASPSIHSPPNSPAAFVLILQQMLLTAASMLTVVALARPGGGAVATVLGRGIAHLIIYLPALALYLIVLPHFYGFSTLGQPLQLFALASVFVLATSFMGQAVGAWFKHPETPTLIFLGTSLPQFFLAGFSWPREAIPKPVLALS